MCERFALRLCLRISTPRQQQTNTTPNNNTKQSPIINTNQGVCHRDLKLENTLLDGSPAPRLKICDFGYSKSALDSQPKSTVGTPAYIAPEVLQRAAYNGHTADVWSCGVILYVLLVRTYTDKCMDWLIEDRGRDSDGCGDGYAPLYK